MSNWLPPIQAWLRPRRSWFLDGSRGNGGPGWTVPIHSSQMTSTSWSWHSCICQATKGSQQWSRNILCPLHLLLRAKLHTMVNMGPTHGCQHHLRGKFCCWKIATGVGWGAVQQFQKHGGRNYGAATVWASWQFNLKWHQQPWVGPVSTVTGHWGLRGTWLPGSTHPSSKCCHTGWRKTINDR